MRKFVLGAALSALVGLGAMGQVLGAPLAEYIGRENLVLIIFHALELTPAQMKAMLKLVEELLPLREEIVAMPEKLHEDLLAFTGTPKELRELLASHQKELREKVSTLEEKFISGLKRILTVAQWERLQRGRVLEEPGARPRPGPGWRALPKERAAPQAFPGLRVDFLRGMALIRFLPTLQEVLTAKLAVLGG